MTTNLTDQTNRKEDVINRQGQTTATGRCDGLSRCQQSVASISIVLCPRADSVQTCLQRPDLAGTASTVLKMVVAMVAAYVFIVVGVLFGGVVGEGFTMVFGFVGLCMLLFALVTFVRFANLVGYLAQAIPKIGSAPKSFISPSI